MSAKRFNIARWTGTFGRSLGCPDGEMKNSSRRAYRRASSVERRFTVHREIYGDPFVIRGTGRPGTLACGDTIIFASYFPVVSPS
jgi:hypothetical protein